MAHIQDRGPKWRPISSRYRGRYTAPDGHERSKTFERKIDAQKWITAQEAAILHGEWLDPALGRQRVHEWAATWMAAEKPALKPKTIASYESLLRSRILPTFGQYRIATLRPSDVQNWIGGMVDEGVSTSRIRQAHVVLSRMLKAAVRDGLVGRNVAQDATLPRQQRNEAAFLDPDAVETIAATMPEPYDLMVRLMGTVRPRFGEVAALRRRSVDLLRRRLRIEESMSEVNGILHIGPPKNHQTRAIPLLTGLAAALEEHLDRHVPADPEAFVFMGPGGGRLRHIAFYGRTWVPALKNLGLPHVGLHALRHSAAARMISAGASAKAIQTVLGHASVAFTLTVYGHMFDSDLDALADRLDQPNSELPRHVDGTRMVPRFQAIDGPS
jgi:integrase